MPSHAFVNAKAQALTKGDKSSAGRIDPRAVSVCGAVNASDWLFTTSSCSGRCYLWRGEGVKATASFTRGRVSHDRVDASYFLDDDVREERAGYVAAPLGAAAPGTNPGALWLRFEPFILHVRCHDAAAAAALMRAARTVFKNVGLQSADFAADGVCVAVVGDEGLDMPLRDESGAPLFTPGHADWLARTINEKHDRNWAKMARFEAAARRETDALAAARADDQDVEACVEEEKEDHADDGARRAPKLRYDAVGDVACLRRPLRDGEDGAAVAARVLASNAKLRVVVAPAAASTLAAGAACAPSEPLTILGGNARRPLVTTHREHDVAVVVDLDACFFSPKLATERLRVSKAVARGERVLCLFCGCGPEALIIAAKTACESVVAVEANAVAVNCLRRSVETLRRSKGATAADKLTVVHADVLRDLDERARNGETFDRVLAPRPKGARDGDRLPPSGAGAGAGAGAADGGGDGGGGPDGVFFLRKILPLMKPTSVLHWTDFAAERELPDCRRTKDFIAGECAAFGASCHFLHCAKAGSSSVAAKQYRVTLDVRLADVGPRAPSVHPHNLPLRGSQKPHVAPEGPSS